MPKEQATGLNVPQVTTPSQLERAARAFYLDREAARRTPVTLTWYRKYVGAPVDWLTGWPSGVMRLGRCSSRSTRAARAVCSLASGE